MTEEEFRPIAGFEDYAVSNLGNVRGKRFKNKILKPTCCKHTDFYQHIKLYKNGKKKCFSIHRLVGLIFIPNPDNLPTIDHIDRNRSNNNVHNLRWASRKMQANNQKPFRKIKNKSGERYIHFYKECKNKYRLIIKNKHINNGKLISKHFHTIEEAVVYRDKLISDALMTTKVANDLKV